MNTSLQGRTSSETSDINICVCKVAQLL
ncbi:rCG55104 [Rattus norvegicus]|uniref:RCG55104 n=1 Tax=Rattus norvegicus TaxID=10116 RepID=A6II89_RAT|nr:rCG55104 [Rattus norvegicus]